MNREHQTIYSQNPAIKAEEENKTDRSKYEKNSSIISV